MESGSTLEQRKDARELQSADSPEFESGTFDLVAYAHKHRYRIRNLHDGGPVPPARQQKKSGRGAGGYTSGSDRCDAIVGRDGYITSDNLDGLSITLFYRSSKGVNAALPRIEAMDGHVDQVGDCELSATIPREQIESALKLIKVSKVPNRNPAGHPSTLTHPVPETVCNLESHEARDRYVYTPECQTDPGWGLVWRISRAVQIERRRMTTAG